MSGADRRLMARALALAARGAGTTHPNPRVGAVVARAGRVLGEGWHRAPGGPHAEPLALAGAGSLSRGSTLYVTLEPCAHQGRTPPCVDAIIAAGVARVVVACRDPDPRVNGRGVERLRRAGIAVVEGVMEGEARELNRAYLHARSTGLPFVTLKLAQSLDGRIACAEGRGQAITGKASLRAVHRLRAEADAVMVGVGTVLADDPALTARKADGSLMRRQPVRVVLDPSLRTPISSRLVAVAGDGRTLLLVGDKVTAKRRAPYLARGVRFLPLEAIRGRFSWADAGRALAKEGLLSVLAEGGSATAAWLWREGAVSRLELFIAPLLMGGDGVPAFAALGVDDPRKAPRLRILRRRLEGDDLRLTAEPERQENPCSPV